MNESETQWIEEIIEVKSEYCSIVESVANQFTNCGFYTEDYRDLETQVMEIAHVDLIEQDLLDKPKDRVWIHLYFSKEGNPEGEFEKIRAALVRNQIDFTVRTSEINQQDWANEWKKYYHILEVGNRLAVVPSWEEYSGDRVVLKLDPGMAFGTGTHETTLLCLKALDQLIQGEESVLDIGTGSGILGIGAVLLGASRAQGIDIDPMAVKTANENALRNGVENKFIARKGDLAKDVNGKFRLITANIIADAIIALSPALPSLLEKDGVLLASGIISSRTEEVRDALQAAGFSEIDEFQDKDWILLQCKIGED